MRDIGRSSSVTSLHCRNFLNRFAAVATATLAACILFAALEFLTHWRLAHHHALAAIDWTVQLLDHELRETQVDLDLLSGTPSIRAAFGEDARGDRAAATRALADLAAARRRYVRLRLLDADGRDLVRIDAGGEGSPAIMADPQDDRAQGWFRQGMSLQAGEMLALPLQGPAASGGGAPALLIRFVAAVVDPHLARGLIVLESLMPPARTAVLQPWQGMARPMLMDGAGRPLDGNGAAGSAASAARSFADLYPDAWPRIARGFTGQVISLDGAFTYATLAYSSRKPVRGGAEILRLVQEGAGADAPLWKIVVHQSWADLARAARAPWLAMLAGASLAVGAALSALLTREAGRRARARDALRASKAELRAQLSLNETLLDSLPTPVFLKGTDGRYLGCNPAFAALAGHDPSDIVGHTIHDLLPPEQACVHARMDHEVLERREKRAYEVENTSRAGRVRHLIVCKSPFLLEGGSIGGLIGVVLDISERKNAERALRESHAFCERLLNTIPQPVFVKNGLHQYVFLNDAACGAFGFAREEMLGRTGHDLFPREQADSLASGDETVLAGGEARTSEERYTDARGQEHVILTKRAVFADETGRDVLVGVITDITERKRTEEMLRLSAEVFDHSTDGILITDRRSVILSVNRAFSEITGYRTEEAIGRNPRFLGTGQPDRAYFREVFRTIERSGHWRGDIVNRRRSGEVYVCGMTICGVRGGDGQIQRYIAIMNDVTERRYQEDRLRHLAQHDFLTGLANRGLLGDRVGHAILRAQRSRGKVALLMLDLDDFKAVNDTYGHATGDHLLKQVALRLLGSVRQTDTVARIGGDEFVVVLTDIHSREDAERIAAKISEELEPPFIVDGRRLPVGASIGVALYPDDATDHEGLCRTADSAMYRMKRAQQPAASASPAARQAEGVR